MYKLEEMYIKLKMDRSVDPNIHYISPDGYRINGKWFDFMRSGGSRIESDDTVVEFELFKYEEGNEGPITLEDLNKGFDEINIYTGEDPYDPPLFVEKVLEIGFNFRDDVTGKEMGVLAAEGGILLESANNIVREFAKEAKEEADYEDR